MKPPSVQIQHRVLAVCVLIGALVMLMHIDQHLPDVTLWRSGPFRYPAEEVAPSDSTCDSQGVAGSKVTVIDPDGIWVHIEGEIESPGVYQVPPGTRIMALVDFAGGLTAEADSEALNLAAVAVDGDRISVPAVGRIEDAEPSRADPTTSRININTADGDKLQTLPGVGPVLAERIVDYRRRHGRFYSVSELVRVKGIGKKTLKTLEPLVLVD